MPNPKKPFRLNVGFIVHEDVGYTHAFPFEFDQVRLGDDLDMKNFNGVAEIGRTPQGLIVQGNFSGETMLECVRCLRVFHQSLSWQITELYAFNKKSVSESGLLLPEDAQIDLRPLLRDYALLEVPINPLHSVDCLGLCPVCGQDLNIRDCGHRPTEPESPLSKLKTLL